MINGMSCGSCDFALGYEPFIGKCGIVNCDNKKNIQRYGQDQNRIDDVCALYANDVPNVRPKTLNEDELKAIVFKTSLNSIIDDVDNEKELVKLLLKENNIRSLGEHSLLRDLIDDGWETTCDTQDELWLLVDAISDKIEENTVKWVKKFSITPKYNVGQSKDTLRIISIDSEKGYYWTRTPQMKENMRSGWTFERLEMKWDKA